LSLGVAIYVGTWPFYAVPILLFFLCNGIFIPFEEEKMARQFGPAFDAYRARVRRWI
jgi:protein-S-isoprenylcysteine O-methyltransferase Ste14